MFSCIIRQIVYPVPSVIIVKLPINKEAGTSPTKVWFPASDTNIGKPKLTYPARL